MMTWFIAMCILANHSGNIGSGIRITRQLELVVNSVSRWASKDFVLQPVPSVLLRPAAQTMPIAMHFPLRNYWDVARMPDQKA